MFLPVRRRVVTSKGVGWPWRVVRRGWLLRTACQTPRELSPKVAEVNSPTFSGSAISRGSVNRATSFLCFFGRTPANARGRGGAIGRWPELLWDEVQRGGVAGSSPPRSGWNHGMVGRRVKEAVATTGSPKDLAPFREPAIGVGSWRPSRSAHSRSWRTGWPLSR